MAYNRVEMRWMPDIKAFFTFALNLPLLLWAYLWLLVGLVICNTLKSQVTGLGVCGCGYALHARSSALANDIPRSVRDRFHRTNPLIELTEISNGPTLFHEAAAKT